MIKTYKVGVPYSDGYFPKSLPFTREDEALAFACGVELGGNKAEVFMQNSGLGTCTDTLTSLVFPYCFNPKLFIKDRTEPDQHKLMGRCAEKIERLIRAEADRCNF